MAFVQGQSPREPNRALRITPMERRALQLLANGHPTGDVATGLGVSTLEIENVLTTLFSAMGAATRAEAVAAARKRGLLTGQLA